ncbi:MAG TPA: hypothetical protein DCR93_11670 [Cytophagales bacterium]|nr:hypothetical protein [Cytophagales bacterium]
MKLSTLIKIGALGLLWPSLGWAQGTIGGTGYYADVLQYSQNELMGTARMQGLGGAKASLGGDISLISVNPAGLGFFNKTAISITPGVYSQRANASYLDNQATDFVSPLALGSFGVVFNDELQGPTGDWRGGNLAIAHTRLNTYREKITYQGDLTGLDTYDDFLGYAINDLNQNGLEGSSELAFSAWDTFLVEEFVDENNNPFFDTYIFPPSEEFPVTQTEVIDITGRKNVFNISYGANYRDKFYIGAGIGFVSMQREITRTYSEVPFQDPDVQLLDLTITEELDQSGNGFNANIGVIYRPVKFLTLGASVETPTFMNMDETFSQFVTANYTFNFPVEEAAGQSFESGAASDSPFAFTMLTPMRARGGATIFLGKLGFISADVEYVDYGTASVSASGSSLTADNELIQAYDSQINYSIGGELRKDAFYARAGYSHRGDPVRERLDGTNASLNYYTAGVGIRKERFFIDGAYVLGQTQSEWRRYANSPVAQVAQRESRIAVTLGVNF